MVKIKSRTWAEKDDPIFTGRFTCSSHRNVSIFNERNHNEKISKSKLSNFQKDNPDSYKTQNDKGRDLFKSNKKSQITGIKNNQRFKNSKIKEKNHD